MTEPQREWMKEILREYESHPGYPTYSPAYVCFKSYEKTLWTIHKPGDHRQNSVVELVKRAYEKSERKDFEFVVLTEDVPRHDLNNVSFCFATPEKEPENFSRVVPCYAFNSLGLKNRYGYHGEGDDSYPAIVNQIIEAGKEKPYTDLCGWCGSAGVSTRYDLIKKCNEPPLSEFCEVIEMKWSLNRTNKTWPENFISLQDQVKRWRYLIDVKGLGWTDRTKFFFFSNRVILYLQREFNEYYFKNLEPWKHYAPLETIEQIKEVVEKLRSDPELEDFIKHNQFQFAVENLKQEDAIDYYRKIMDETDWHKELEPYRNKEKSLDNELPWWLKFGSSEI